MQSWKWMSIVALGLWAGGAMGCKSELESGYMPRKLSASNAERRAFYAEEFSPEARAAAEERQQEFEARRPTR